MFDVNLFDPQEVFAIGLALATMISSEGSSGTSSSYMKLGIIASETILKFPNQVCHSLRLCKSYSNLEEYS